MIARTAVFIGHRDYTVFKGGNLRAAIEELILQGYTRFYCGGIGNFDRVCARTVLILKASYPHIRIYLVLPCARWPIKMNMPFDGIIVSDQEKTIFKRRAVMLRNRFMIENASAAVCYVRRCRGGAYRSWEYALESGIKIINI